MKKIYTSLTALAFAFASSGYAQEAKPEAAKSAATAEAQNLQAVAGTPKAFYEGTWTRRTSETRSGVVLKLDATVGTARIYSKGGPFAACFRGKVPVEVVSSTENSVTILMKLSSIASQCDDSTATLPLINDGGKFGLGVLNNPNHTYWKE